MTSVQRLGRRFLEINVGVFYQCFHVAVRSAYGPMNAQCLTIQSCKGFVYLYMVMGKINH